MTRPIAIGESAEVTHHITAGLVQRFADVSGDTNPIHLDEEFARTSRFGRRIAHGMLAAGFLSALLGNVLPGRGAVYLSQHLRFVRPVFIGDTITAVVEVVAVRGDKPIVTMRTFCRNQDDEIVVDGEAVLMYSAPRPDRGEARS